METEQDYITVMPTVHPDRFIVCKMEWRRGEYVQGRVHSRSYGKETATIIANSWAHSLGLEVR